jgi:hypothetical protein
MSGEDRLKRKRGRPSNVVVRMKNAVQAQQNTPYLEEEALQALESMAVTIAVIDHNLKSLMKNLAKKHST